MVQKKDCFLVPDGYGVGGQRGDPGDFLPEEEKNGTGTADAERESGVGRTLVKVLPMGFLVQTDGDPEVGCGYYRMAKTFRTWWR
ncbi:hypothetical protein [Streptomyces sp. R08]|uniref:Uncharacterized protein n=1 Tax=Streptomyces sp. R08 TaxID=3238624 RepID=A0AB39M7S3_9ACTN